MPNDDDELMVSLARLAGEHALPLFLLLLGGVLTASWAAWWTLQHHAVPRLRSRLPPGLFMALPIAGGFALIVAGASVFAELAEELGTGDEMARADQALTDALRRSVPAAAIHVFAVLTRLGDTATLVVLCVLVATVLLVRGRPWLALGWVCAVGGNGLLNQTLKHVFARARPVHDDGLVLADGFSFPSGHSSGAVVTYTMLAYLALRLLSPRWHLPAVLGAVALAVTVGASRIFLRVHFASDVVAGFASGAAWLAVCIAAIEGVRWRLQPARSV